VSLDSELIGVLKADAGMLALVDAAKIWGGKAKDNPIDSDYPHAVFRFVDDNPEMVGMAPSTPLLASVSRYQVEGFSKTSLANAKAIADAAKNALHGYRSADATPPGTLIKTCQYEMQVALPYDDVLKAWAVSTDFMIKHEG
jgi:hypothetical protein